MGVKAFTDGVRALIEGGDAQFAADIQQLLGMPVARVLRANTPWEQIGAHLLPCFVMEQAPGQASGWGTGEDSGMVIGHGAQGFASELDVCLLWQQPDREAAADQRAQLPEIFVRLLLRNPQPGGVNAAWVQEWMPDQGVRHPLQCWVVRIRGNYEITRTP